MTRPPLQPLTGTPLDYVPIDAPVQKIEPIPDRPPRLWGYVWPLGTFIVGLIVGALL